MKKMLVVIMSLVLLMPAATLADSVNTSPIGRWTIASSYDEVQYGYMFAKTDLLFFDDGNVFRFSVSKKNHVDDIEIAHDGGIWIGDKDKMIVRFPNKTFNAYIDENGFLYLENNDTTNMFIRVCYIEEEP